MVSASHAVKMGVSSLLTSVVVTCVGENPDRVYRQTRMDAAWNFRNAYNEARKIKEAQDEFCALVDEERWES